MNNKVKFLAVSIATVCVASAAFAEEEDKGTAINAGISLTDGNSETLVAHAGIDHKGGSESTPVEFGIEGNYGESTVENADGETTDETTVENVNAYAGLKHLYSDTLYSYLRGDALYDDVAGVDSRLSIGPGIGNYFVKSDTTELSGEIGAAYVWEELDGGEAEDISEDYAALRVAQELSHKLSETARVWESVEYLPEFEEFDNYLLNSEIGIEAAVNSHMSLRLVYQYRYDATPAEGREEGDSALIGGLSYKL